MQIGNLLEPSDFTGAKVFKLILASAEWWKHGLLGTKFLLGQLRYSPKYIPIFEFGYRIFDKRGHNTGMAATECDLQDAVYRYNNVKCPWDSDVIGIYDVIINYHNLIDITQIKFELFKVDDTRIYLKYRGLGDYVYLVYTTGVGHLNDLADEVDTLEEAVNLVNSSYNNNINYGREKLLQGIHSETTLI